MYTMLLIFTLKGVSSSNIGTLTFQVYPNSFKWLAAPFIDTYFCKFFGKRKTYLVLLSVLHSIMIFVLSFYINDWVENENIVKITLFGFIWNTTGLFKVSAHLAWGVTHFRPEIKGQGYSWMQFGSALGAVTAIPIFLFLNSDSFCEWFGFSGAILSHRVFCIFISICNMAGAMWIQFGVAERDPKDDGSTERPGMCKTFLYIRRFCSNRVLRNYCGFILT